MTGSLKIYIHLMRTRNANNITYIHNWKATNMKRCITKIISNMQLNVYAHKNIQIWWLTGTTANI